MENVPLPENEQARLMVLKTYNIMDTPPESELDDLTRLASIFCNTPVALITLVDQNRQWFKANIGFNATETPRDVSFCQHTILANDIYEVPNAAENALFAHYPYVTGDAHIRFYAGAPLINTDGFALGTLCVLDTVPRTLDPQQKETLKLLARLVIQQFELRRKKNEVEHARMLYHKMVEEVADIIYTSDHNGNFTYINQKVSAILGYKPEDLTGKNFTEIIVPEWRPRVIDFYSDQFQNKQAETKYEFPVITKTGETRWVEQSVAAVINEGRIQGFQGIVRDITERKKYESELLETKALLTQAMTIGRMGSFENNVVTQKITWSKEIYDIMDMLPGEKPLSQEEFMKTVHPDDLPEVLMRIQKVAATKKPDVNVNRFITAKAKVKWIETRVVPIFDLDGNLLMFRGTMQDITEQKEIEKLLINAKELAEQSGMAKEQFLANMSHEIRTPLNAVLGFADLLDHTRLSEEQKEFVHAIQASGKNLLAIINDILDYSKIEAGMMTIEETPLSVRSIFSSLAVLFGQKAKEKNLELSFTSDPAIPETVLGDSTRLTQVITNLVGNAIKFTQKGSVQVHAALSHITDGLAEVRFSVKDTGIGIPADKLGEVFDRFNQGSNSTTRKFGGTGLGLSIVKKLVELQGGSVHVKSKPNAGSTFEFTILFKLGESGFFAEILKHQTPSERQLPETIRVLLAEDNIMNQKLAQRILHNLGFEVEIADNGKIAIEKMKKGHFDIVLMDMQMPEMDGYAAAVAIRRQLNNTVPIIAMTAHAMNGEKEKCLELGMNDYISKPFKPENLQEKILALVSTSNNKKPLLNLDGLHEISGGDKDFVNDMLRVFVTDTPQELGSLSTAIETADYPVIKTIAHKLVSSIGLVGLKDRLLHVLNEMEDLGKTARDLPRIKILYDDLNSVCERAFAEARILLKHEA